MHNKECALYGLVKETGAVKGVNLPKDCLAAASCGGPDNCVMAGAIYPQIPTSESYHPEPRQQDLVLDQPISIAPQA